MNKRFALAIVPIGIGINFVGNWLAVTFKLPVFLDTIGTMLVAVTLGPWLGALTGGLSNVINAITSPPDMWFAIVNILVGLIVGYIALWRGYSDYITPLIAGVVTGIVAPVVGTFIATYVYGGLTGGFADIVVAGLLKSGQSVFVAAFIPRLPMNLVDKIGSAYLVYFVVKALPAQYRGIAVKSPKAVPEAA